MMGWSTNWRRGLLAALLFMGFPAWADPNLYARVSSRLLGEIQIKVNQQNCESQSSGNEVTQGMLYTQGVATARPIPDPARAAILLYFSGTAQAPQLTTSAPFGITVYTSLYTQLEGWKAVYLNADGVAASSAQARAWTNITVNGVDGPPLIRRIAYRKALQQIPSAEYQASTQASQTLSSMLDQQAQDPLREFAAAYKHSVKDPLEKAGIFPDLHFETTNSEVRAEATFPGSTKLPTGHPALPPSQDITGEVHESAIDNISDKLLAGKTLTQTDFGGLIGGLSLGLLGVGEPGGLDFDVVTFDTVRPLTVTFENDRLGLVMRIKSVTLGGDTINDVQISGRFRLEKDTHGQPTLVREGDFEVEPLNPPGGDYRNLRSRFIRSLRVNTPSIPARTNLSGISGLADRIKLVQFTASGAWLTIGYQVMPARTPTSGIAPQAGLD